MEIELEDIGDLGLLGSLAYATGYGVGKIKNMFFGEDDDMRYIAFTSFIGMAVRLAQIDGEFSEDESYSIMETIKNAEEEDIYAKCLEAYEMYIRDSSKNVYAFASDYDLNVDYDKEDREWVYESLFMLACVDNELHKNEIVVLKKLPSILKLNDDIYQTMEKKHLPQQSTTEKLEDLIGLNSVKENIQSIVDSIKIEKLRGGSTIAGHYIFHGNPGTGKTSVARILGQKFKELGLLMKGHLVEVKREDLVGEYIGQTAIKTKEVLNKALGGVLFIDEVYSLSSGGEKDFGLEAINTIVPFIEDNREKMIVIIAGYTEPTNKFLDSNPGLKSRFNHTIEFEDYNSFEMLKIFKLIAKEFTWDDSVDEKLQKYFQYMEETKNHNFGNARDVRKVFETVKKHQISRLVQLDDLVEKDPRLNVFVESDIRF